MIDKWVPSYLNETKFKRLKILFLSPANAWFKFYGVAGFCVLKFRDHRTDEAYPGWSKHHFICRENWLLLDFSMMTRNCDRVLRLENIREVWDIGRVIILLSSLFFEVRNLNKEIKMRRFNWPLPFKRLQASTFSGLAIMSAIAR